MKKSLFFVFCFMFFASISQAQQSKIVIWKIDMRAIARIESSNNREAFNASSGATGLYQITPICLKDFNKELEKKQIEIGPDAWMLEKYTMKDMVDPGKSLMVADWCINQRIPQMLKAYKIKDNVRNRLWAYNAGIGKVRKGIMPEETKSYIVKYENIAREKAK